MKQLKTFTLNGYKYSIDSTVTISDIINYFNYNNSLFVLEYNNFIYEKEKWSQTFIKDNDKIEIVTIVGGG